MEKHKWSKEETFAFEQYMSTLIKKDDLEEADLLGSDDRVLFLNKLKALKNIYPILNQ